MADTSEPPPNVASVPELNRALSQLADQVIACEHRAAEALQLARLVHAKARRLGEALEQCRGRERSSGAPEETCTEVPPVSQP